MVSVQRHLAVLRGMLQPGEAERAWIRAERQPQGHAGALLLTDRRLLFSGLGFVQQSQEAWPLAVVAAARVAGEALTFTVLGLPERYMGKRADLTRLLAALPQGPEVPAGSSLVDTLERLARLHDAGALSDAEFDGAKRRLLDASGEGG